MAKARSVQSGKIWQNRRTREVLWTLLKLQKVENGVLVITGTKKKLEGEIGVFHGIFLTGATINGSNEKGYPAMKRLLEVEEGTFNYYDYGANSLGDLDQGLKLRITQIINLMPNLPVSIEAAMGKNTLNRIRAMDSGEVSSYEEIKVDQAVAEQLRALDEKTMNMRALIFWGIFLVVSSVAAVLFYVKH
ncbi:MAG: hypothetical protein IT342_17470 [Candidatus Melainabacteria bacterium]|nr:hypothetical protein [Candidatus Melainabacteria bacterium]